MQRLDTEELRFIHVAMKQDSHGDEERVVVGQKVVCPKLQLACMTERSLLYGREVWMGYWVWNIYSMLIEQLLTIPYL